MRVGKEEFIVCSEEDLKGRALWGYGAYAPALSAAEGEPSLAFRGPKLLLPESTHDVSCPE